MFSDKIAESVNFTFVEKNHMLSLFDHLMSFFGFFLTQLNVSMYEFVCLCICGQKCICAHACYTRIHTHLHAHLPGVHGVKMTDKSA